MIMTKFRDTELEIAKTIDRWVELDYFFKTLYTGY